MSDVERRFFAARDAGQPDPWFDADPARRQAQAQMEAIWSDLDAMPDLARLAQPQRPRTSRRAVLWGGAGMALAAGIGGVAILPRGDLRTGTGELREAALPDGTGVLLDAASSLDLDFAAGQRLARLRDGRARFRVAAGSGAFTIAAAPGTVTLRQGEVTVHLWDGEMTVACLDGTGHVTTEGGADFDLSAGQEATVGASGAQPVQPLGVGEAEWASGKLVFEDRLLRQVVADLGRYRHGPILLRGAAARDLRVTGVFDAARPDQALEAITAALPLRRRTLGPVTLLTHA